MVLTLCLAVVPFEFEAIWQIGAVSFLIAFFSASQDIALDGYAVELLNKEEQSVAVGGRIAVYRAAMYFAGSMSISLASSLSWHVVYILLACTYLPMMVVTWKALEP